MKTDRFKKINKRWMTSTELSYQDVDIAVINCRKSR